MFHSQSRVERALRRRGAPLAGGKGAPRRGGTGIDAPPSLTPLTSIYPPLPPALRFRRPRAIPPAPGPRPDRARRSLALSRALPCFPRYFDACRVVGGSRRRGGSSSRHSFVRLRAARIGPSLLRFLRVARCVARDVLPATCSRARRVPVHLDLSARARERETERD